ncbi:TPA: helix-turn-helix transcriptional regulator [Serratia marcescens]|nr:helix-turn-helix transcriptional regulator [Serratia marcescens]
MIIHIISDDKFFALGCEWVVKTKSTHELNKISPNNASREYLKKIVNHDDIVLIATNSFFKTKKLLISLSCIGIRALVVEDFIIKKVHGSIHKKSCQNTLLSNIEKICRKNNPSRTILTKREIEVMNGTLQGKSMKSISLSLNIALKTAYIHRRNAYVKIGIRKYKIPIKNRKHSSL